MSDSNPSNPERFPDLYALLGLEPLERESAIIEQALRRLAVQIQANAKTTDASQRQRLQRAHKLFELGKQQLLNSERKQRYDLQWQALYGQSLAKEVKTAAIGSVAVKQSDADHRLAKTTEQSPCWDLRELRDLLPSGDPDELFRAAKFVADSATDLKLRYEDDFAKLQSLLLPTVVETASVEDSVVEEEVPSSEQDLGQIFDPRNVVNPAMDRRATGRRPAPSIAGRLRKKQERGLLWGAIGALTAVAIVLGVAYWLMLPPPDSTLAVKPEGVPRTTLDPENSQLPTADAVPASSRPRRSGLPSVPGIDSSIVVPGMPAPSETTSSPAATVAGGEQSSNTVMSGMTLAETPPAEMPLVEMAADTMGSNTMASDTVQDMPSRTAAMDMSAENMEAVPESVLLSASERKQWSSAMQSVRKTIGQQQFEEATQQLDDARSLAKTLQQTEQLARLVTVEQLAQEFSEALQRALAGMGGAETFMVGQSTPVSFVEFGDGHLTLRLNGQSQTWSMTDLPTGIAFAIADMSLDRDHPRSLAAKAAFTLVHPAAQGKDILTQRAMQMMSTAIDAGAVSEDMAQVFADDYSLPSQG
ncbi:MAG: hypothetical protein ABI557_12375 [Aureliella sp.]